METLLVAPLIASVQVFSGWQGSKFTPAFSRGERVSLGRSAHPAEHKHVADVDANHDDLESRPARAEALVQMENCRLHARPLKGHLLLRRAAPQNLERRPPPTRLLECGTRRTVGVGCRRFCTAHA